MTAARNPDAERGPVEVLVETIELSLNRLPHPIRSLDRAGWAAAIRDEMPWILPCDAEDAAVVFEGRYRSSTP